MSVQTEVTRKCDYCDIAIRDQTRFVAAGSYGADFHAHCFENEMKALDLAKLLGLDEVEYAIASGERVDIKGRAWRVIVEPQLTEWQITQIRNGALS